jgi:hypothetical protein
MQRRDRCRGSLINQSKFSAAPPEAQFSVGANRCIRECIMLLVAPATTADADVSVPGKESTPWLNVKLPAPAGATDRSASLLG